MSASISSTDLPSRVKLYANAQAEVDLPSAGRVLVTSSVLGAPPSVTNCIADAVDRYASASGESVSRNSSIGLADFAVGMPPRNGSCSLSRISSGDLIVSLMNSSAIAASMPITSPSAAPIMRFR